MSFDTSQKPLNSKVNTSGVDFYLDLQIDLHIVDLGLREGMGATGWLQIIMCSVQVGWTLRLREGKTLTQSHADTE